MITCFIGSERSTKFTVDPTDNDEFGEGDDHQREGRAVPVHDLQEVDSTLQ